jgi:GTP cyclohydrolase I
MGSAAPDGVETLGSVAIRPRSITPEQVARFEGYVGEMFSAMGLDLASEGGRATPRRFVRAMMDATEGYEGDAKLVTVFKTECHGGPDCQLSQLVEGPIPFFSLCEHHALPFYGRVFVGYIAHEQIIGLSKLTRLVRIHARRFTVQERLGHAIAETLDELVHPHGIAVYIDAHHMCTQMRGVRETKPLTRSTFWRGRFAEDASLRSDFLRICTEPE